MPTLRAVLRAATTAALALLAPAVAAATPYDLLTVGDPIEAELRALDVAGPSAHRGLVRLARLHGRPLQLVELAPGGPVEVSDAEPALGGAIGLARIQRLLGREEPESGRPPGTTPRLYQRLWPDDQRLEASIGLEGRGEVEEHDSRLLDGAGVHARLAVGFDRWLAYSHLLAGHIDDARRFADPIVSGEDLIVHTEETYVSYTGAGATWSVMLGRGRFHWGPGEEASLLLSKTGPPMTALAARVRVDAIRADGMALNATLDASSGEQLAAHRLEWQPADGLRLGLSEAARYRSDAWQPLYLAGVIPYVLVQRLLWQDAPDSTSSLRNNVLIGLDAAWRIAPGTRVYGELLVDDLHTRTSANPNKLAWQLGLEGVGTVAGTRLVWGTEYTRLSRFVYTSFFGRSFETQGRPLGFPTGPDARRIRVRGAWDLSPAWQVVAAASRTDQGENGLDEPFVPGSPEVEPFDFEGVTEKTRDFEAGLRWWPASGVDVALLGGYRWVDDAGHVAGAKERGPRGALALRLVR